MHFREALSPDHALLAAETRPRSFARERFSANGLHKTHET
jgi:hypothetical protein